LCAGLAQALEGVGPVERLEIAVVGPAGIAASAYSVPSGTPLYADQPITDDSALAWVIRKHKPLAPEAAGVLGVGSWPAVGELGEPVSGSTLILPLLVQGRFLGDLCRPGLRLVPRASPPGALRLGRLFRECHVLSCGYSLFPTKLR
jgi:hypothetical protein